MLCGSRRFSGRSLGLRGLGSGCRSWGRARWRLGRCSLGGLRRCGDARGGECSLQFAGDRGLDARGRALDVFAHLFELVEGDLAVDAEFGSNFVYAWFRSHNSPVWACTRTGADH